MIVVSKIAVAIVALNDGWEMPQINMQHANHVIKRRNLLS